MAAKPAAGPQPPLAFDPASYASPGVPAAAAATADSTPRLLWGAKPPAAGPAAAAAAVPAPACAEPQQPEPTAAQPVPAEAVPAAAPAAAPVPAPAPPPKPRGLQGRRAQRVHWLRFVAFIVRTGSTMQQRASDRAIPSPFPMAQATGPQAQPVVSGASPGGRRRCCHPPAGSGRLLCRQAPAAGGCSGGGRRGPAAIQQLQRGQRGRQRRAARAACRAHCSAAGWGLRLPL